MICEQERNALSNNFQRIIPDDIGHIELTLQLNMKNEKTVVNVGIS